MASPFDELQPSSFAGIGFGVTRWGVKGAYRHHMHEYPGSPGGQDEGIGRRYYIIEFDAVFSANDPVHSAEELAFTDTLNKIRILFEKGEIGPLVVPHLGTLPTCRAIDWDEQADPARMRDGIRMKMTFVEISEEELSIDDVIRTTASSLASKIELFYEAIAPLEEPEPDLFESFENLANEVQGVMDQAELAGDQLGAKVAGVTSKMNQLDESISELGDVEKHAVVRALHDLGATLAAYGEQVGQAVAPKSTYVTPKTMSATEVSIAVFGDTSHAIDILKSNRAAIDDAFAIPEGTSLKV